MHRFACYDEYMGDFEQAKNIYNKMLKNKGFRGFIERTQHAANDVGNSGLRELMIEPLQRIPRYRLLMNNIMKEMPTSSVQYQRLHEASSLAGHIASREVNNATRRAAILWSCARAIDRFPEELAASRRELLGCIDVEESSAEAQTGMLHALTSVLGQKKRAAPLALLVFDDILVVVQRHSSHPTHQVLRVQEPEKLVDMMQLEQTRSPVPNKKHELSFAGAIDLRHVRATGLDGRQAQFAFLEPLRGSGNAAETRVFADANASTELPRMALFLDCLWKAQAVHRARARALQVRASVLPASETRGAHAMLWTLLTPSQFQRFPHKTSPLFQIGSVDSAAQLQQAHELETCVNVEIHAEKKTGTVTILRAFGTQRQELDVVLRDIPALMGDVCNGTAKLPEPAPVSPQQAPAEVPVRRTKSLRAPSRNMPGAHRARSLMSERVRASIQSSLEAVMESQELEAQEDTSPGQKRTMPLGDVGNLSPKRRAVSRASGQENAQAEDELVKEYERMDTECEKGSTTPMETSPARSALKMRAEETQQLQSPFEAEAIEMHGHALDRSLSADSAEVEKQLEPHIAPEPVKEPAADEERVVAQLAKDADAAEAKSDMAEDKPEELEAPKANEPQAEAPQAEARDVAEDKPKERKEPEAEKPKGAAANKVDEPTAAPTATATATLTVVDEPESVADAPASLAAASDQPPAVPEKPSRPASVAPSRTPSASSARQVTEEEMQEMLRPLLGQLHDAPMPQQAVCKEAPAVPAPQQAEIEGRETQDMDLTVLRLLQEEQVRESDVPPVPVLDGLKSPAVDMPDVATPVIKESVEPDHESRAMRHAMARVNEMVATLRKHRPATAARDWQSDWAQFKQAIKAMNICWTHMERAYENKQMDLASLRLAQPEHDPCVRVPADEYMSLQDEANMVVPLRIQIEQLNKKCDALSTLEQDTRMENAELYNVFNEELSQLYKHSFRPADEEIETLRQSLLAAKEELHALRVENKDLRQQCALAHAT